MNIGDNIKKFRTKVGLTQDELATKCGLSKNGLWNYENNKRQPSIETLEKIAESLNISFIQLIGFNDLKDEFESLKREEAILFEKKEQLKGKLSLLREYENLLMNLKSTNQNLMESLKKNDDREVLKTNVNKSLSLINQFENKKLIGVLENPLTNINNNVLTKTDYSSPKFENINVTSISTINATPHRIALDALWTLLNCTNSNIELTESESEEILSKIYDLLELEVFKLKKSRGIEIK